MPANSTGYAPNPSSANNHSGKQGSPDPSPKPPRKRGPYQTIYSPELYQDIVDEIANGSITILEACKKFNVPVGTFVSWTERDQWHSDLFRQARASIGHWAMTQARRLVGLLAAPEDLPSDARVAKLWIDSWERAGKLAIEVAKRTAPTEYGDRLDQRIRSENVSYVISYSPAAQDVPVQLQPPPPVGRLQPPSGVAGRAGAGAGGDRAIDVPSGGHNPGVSGGVENFPAASSATVRKIARLTYAQPKNVSPKAHNIRSSGRTARS
jgi:hypothetical protein